jgi:hypothetical protein
LLTQGSADVTEKVTQSQNAEKDTLRGKSTRKRKPSVCAIGSERLQLSCTGYTSQADQLEYSYKEDTEAPLLAHPRPQVAQSPSSAQRSDTHKLDTAVYWAGPVAPSPLKRKRGVKYVKPTRTALKNRKKPAGLLPTPASSTVVSQLPCRCLHVPPNGLNSAPVQHLKGLHTGHVAGTGSVGRASSTGNIVSQDHSLPDSNSRISEVNQRLAGVFASPQKHSVQSIDTAIDVPHWENKGGWETRCFQCRGGAPSSSRCASHGGDDPFKDKSNAITVEISTSGNRLELLKRNISNPFVSTQGHSTAPETVLEAPRPNAAIAQ